MESPYITGRGALAEASDLMERFGDDAGLEAAARAEQSRDSGNVIRFCHWRQIERVIATLSDEEVRGTVHYGLLRTGAVQGRRLGLRS